MNRAGVLKALALLSTLWTNYRPPTTADDINAVVAAWLTMMQPFPDNAVHNAIFRYSATGAEFAPSVGQIYKEIKDEYERKKEAKASIIRLKQINDVEIN